MDIRVKIAQTMQITAVFYFLVNFKKIRRTFLLEKGTQSVRCTKKGIGLHNLKRKKIKSSPFGRGKYPGVGVPEKGHGFDWVKKGKVFGATKKGYRPTV